MTDIYKLISRRGNGKHPDIFIGHPLTGGHGIVYYEEHKIYEIAPQKITDIMINYIREDGNGNEVRPEKINNRKIEYVEKIIDELEQEIEEFKNGEKTSKGFRKKVDELLLLLN